jgi:hypothetical protein
MQAALRGVFEGSTLYATHTEYHYQLARAFDGLGQADSARRHFGIVAQALHRSDQEAAPMRVEAEKALGRLR